MSATADAADTPWTIGAAKVDTTPAAFNSAQDLQDFPEATCPRSVYNGPRLWRFEEPFQDTDGSGDFNYPNGVAEPFCDFNQNGRWEGMYLSGGTDQQAKTLHDKINARAVAFTGDNGQTVVLVSVVAQGVFENYIAEARAKAELLASQGSHQQSCGHIDEMVVSSNHNESSPDTVGIYGAPPDPTGSFGLHSSIDEYYMDWLDDQIANAAVAACDNRQPASLREVEFPLPSGLKQEIPGRFPTTADDRSKPTSIDDKVRVLQARNSSGSPIFTMMNLADHNQDIGHSDNFLESHSLSSDWPGYFHRRLEQDVGGMAMFLVADNGSMEDLITDPQISTTDHPECNTGCFAQVQATGAKIADEVAARLGDAKPIPIGSVGGQRTEFCAPLENNLFRAAAQAGIFGERQTYQSTPTGDCAPAGRGGQEVKTSIAVLDVGPDLQFIVNPGEAFPALMLGGPWGIEDASCPNRANPPVPTWLSTAKYRFQVGLGDDLIGYEKPAWSFLFDTPGSFTPTDCTSDPHNHSHALEDEALGPTAANLVAQNLAVLIGNPDPAAAEVRLGRYVKADGTLTNAYVGTPDHPDQGAPGHFPTDAVAIWLADPGSTTLNANPHGPASGTIVALNNVASFGSRSVDASGDFIDFDGAEQGNTPNIDTRGMAVTAGGKRYYVNVYPALTVSGSLAPAIRYSCDGIPATILGTAGADTITGTTGDDVIVGLGGDDTIVGGGGDDKVCGGDGNDNLTGGRGADYLSGGAGDDTVTYETRTAGVTVTLDGSPNDGNAADQSSGSGDDVQSDVETVIGTKGSDTITGDGGNNTVRGKAGDDTLNGLGGGDLLVGNAGNDILTGGPGADTFGGRDGNDTVFANDGTADAAIDCDGGPTPGTADSAHVDALDPAPTGCESVGP